MFSFPIMKWSLCFTDVKIIAVPATSFVNGFRLLTTIQPVLLRKERFDPASVLKNCQVDKRVELCAQDFRRLEIWLLCRPK